MRISPDYQDGYYVYEVTGHVFGVTVKQKPAQQRVNAKRSGVAILVHGHQAGARDWNVYVSGGTLVADPPPHATGMQPVIVEVPGPGHLNLTDNA